MSAVPLGAQQYVGLRSSYQNGLRVAGLHLEGWLLPGIAFLEQQVLVA